MVIPLGITLDERIADGSYIPAPWPWSRNCSSIPSNWRPRPAHRWYMPSGGEDGENFLIPIDLLGIMC